MHDNNHTVTDATETPRHRRSLTKVARSCSDKHLVANEKMGFDTPLIPTDLERCHRLGRVVPGQKRPRAVIVRFVSERMRDSVYRARGSLKGYNDGKEQHTRIFINEDLTARRATICVQDS